MVGWLLVDEGDGKEKGVAVRNLILMRANSPNVENCQTWSYYGWKRIYVGWKSCGIKDTPLRLVNASFYSMLDRNSLPSSFFYSSLLFFCKRVLKDYYIIALKYLKGKFLK